MESKPPVKTLIVDLAERFGGASMRVVSLLRGLPQGTAALASLADSPVTQEALKAGCTVYIVGERKADPRILPRLVRVVRQGGYQILDTQNIQSKFWSSFAALWTGSTLVSTLNSWYASEHHKNPFKGNLYLSLEFMTSWKLARTITVSREIYNDLMKYGFDPHKVDLIYNAVDLSPESVPEIRPQLLSEYNIPSNAVVCLAAGRLVWAKGHNILVEALSTITKIPVYCFIVGEGELRNPLEAQIEGTRLGDRVKLLGFAPHDRTLALIKACDIFVMPSNYEGTPVALLEAAALARPILATRVGGIGELVENEKEALLVNAGDPIALAQAILRLVRDPRLARRLGQSAFERVQREFSLARLADATQASYRTALETSRLKCKP